LSPCSWGKPPPSTEWLQFALSDTVQFRDHGQGWLCRFGHRHNKQANWNSPSLERVSLGIAGDEHNGSASPRAADARGDVVRGLRRVTCCLPERVSAAAAVRQTAADLLQCQFSAALGPGRVTA
jgi:hypothetical protein